MLIRTGRSKKSSFTGKLPGDHLIQYRIVIILTGAEYGGNGPLKRVCGVVLHIGHDRLQSNRSLLYRDARLRGHQVNKVLDRFMDDSLAHFFLFHSVREKACQQ